MNLNTFKTLKLFKAVGFSLLVTLMSLDNVQAQQEKSRYRSGWSKQRKCRTRQCKPEPTEDAEIQFLLSYSSV